MSWNATYEKETKRREGVSERERETRLTNSDIANNNNTCELYIQRRQLYQFEDLLDIYTHL